MVTLTVGAMAHLLLSSGSFNMALSRANCALKENACTAGYSSINMHEIDVSPVLHGCINWEYL